MCLICANVTDIRIKKKSTDRYKKTQGTAYIKVDRAPKLSPFTVVVNRPLQANP